jgi:hypothetical protein
VCDAFGNGGGEIIGLRWRFGSACGGVFIGPASMSQLANETGLTRDTLYKAFSQGGNPTLETLFRVLDALGIKLVAIPAAHPVGSDEVTPA